MLSAARIRQIHQEIHVSELKEFLQRVSGQNWTKKVSERTLNATVAVISLEVTSTLC